MELINNIDNPQHFPKTALKWQGKNVKVEALELKVREVKDKPLYWSNFDVEQQRSINLGHDYAIIEALKIWYSDKPFYISNHFGIGIRKLRKGGWPGHTHFGFNGNFEEYRTNSQFFPTINFCLKDYEYQEALRREWRKKNYPEEFEKNERLARLIVKSPIYGRK